MLFNNRLCKMLFWLLRSLGCGVARTFATLATDNSNNVRQQLISAERRSSCVQVLEGKLDLASFQEKAPSTSSLSRRSSVTPSPSTCPTSLWFTVSLYLRSVLSPSYRLATFGSIGKWIPRTKQCWRHPPWAFLHIFVICQCSRRKQKRGFHSHLSPLGST